MSKGSFTPGPWLAMRGSESTGREVADWAVTVDDDGTWICTGPTWDSKFQDESYANARLIAAAPDLLEALELVSDLAGREWQEADGSRKGATDNSGKRMWFIGDDVMLLVRERIAKARGDA